MSLSLQPSYVASLALDSTAVVRLAMDFKSLPFKSRVVEKRHATFEAVANDRPWQTALLELQKLIVQSQSTHKRGGLPLSIVLSNQFVRYKVIPALPAFTPADKALAIATHCFREGYGDAVDDWSIKVNPLPDGDTLLACAIDASLLMAIQALAKQHGCRLKSMQAHLMSGFNTMHRHIKPPPSCYAQIEAGRITIALVRDGAWQSIAACGTGPEWDEPLSSLITREMLLAGWPHEQLTIYLATPDTLHDKLATKAFIANTSWKTDVLNTRPVAGYSVTTDQVFAMALSAAG
ncbi:MAG: hypothetical protein ACAH10_02585 [Methylophilaceae bacterium]